MVRAAFFRSMDSTVDNGISKEQYHGVSVSTREVDSAAQLAVRFSGALDPEEALRIRFVETAGSIAQFS